MHVGFGTYFLMCFNFFIITEGIPSVTMGMVLAFFTGAEAIPPLGLGDAILNFSDTNPYPTASTCGLCLTLPTKHCDYDTFKEKFLFAMENHGGFGLA